MNQHQTILLASGSPRRSELLGQLGLQFQVLVTDVEETLQAGESPQDFVRRLAAEKALAGLAASPEKLPVLGADTVVLLDGQILGKPRDRNHAEQMLAKLAGRQHQVLSAVALALPDGAVELLLNTTDVWFGDFPEGFIEWYCATDEPMDKAGAYAIQGATGQFIARIDGSFSGVMGLPVFETSALLRAAGILS